MEQQILKLSGKMRVIEIPRIIPADEMPAAKCPRCGDEVEMRHHAATFASPECTVRWCETCGWEGEPE